MSSAFRLPLLFRCSSISFFVNNSKYSRDLHHGTSLEVFTFSFSMSSAMVDFCPPEPRFHALACGLVTYAGKVYRIFIHNNRIDDSLYLLKDFGFSRCAVLKDHSYSYTLP